MRIGEAAAQAGVSIQTLRYYERRGLLGRTERRASGYRDYDMAGIRRVRFIKRAQQLGFSLAEVEGLLAMRDGTGEGRTDVQAVARAKVADIDERIRHLRAMRGALERLIDTCCSDGSVRECPIIEALDESRRLTPSLEASSSRASP